MTNYRSLIGGYFSSTPMDKSKPATVRANNPGAINGTKWEERYPGYVGTQMITGGNPATIFEAPEYGVGAWWDLMRRYRANNKVTVHDIITRYGGAQDYSPYVRAVAKATGFAPDTTIDLNNDQQLLKFGSAMFRYEAGRPLPWSDAQILHGIQCGRAYASTRTWPDSPPINGPKPGPEAPGQVSNGDLLALLQKLLAALAANAANPPAVQTAGGTGSTPAGAGNTPAPVILSFIDKIFGGEALAGSKTMLGVIAYVIVALLKSAGVLGAATPAGQILSVLSIAFTALGGLAKIDRMILSLGTIAGSSK